MAESVHKAILDAVRVKILTLGLVDYPTENELLESRIVVAWGIDAQPQGMPAIFICPAGTWSVIGGTNREDDYSYSVAIFIVDRIAPGYTPPMDAAMIWRESIAGAFISKRLTGVPSVYICQADAAPAVDRSLAEGYQLLVQPVNLRFLSRELRD